jgi:hypothetical protein
MRRLLTLSALLAVLSVTFFLATTTTPLFATTCTTNCSLSTLSCTPVNYCTSVPGTSLDCDGTVTTCAAADAWCACYANCDALCAGTPGPKCLHACVSVNCGSKPANTLCN